MRSFSSLLIVMTFSVTFHTAAHAQPGFRGSEGEGGRGGDRGGFGGRGGFSGGPPAGFSGGQPGFGGGPPSGGGGFGSRLDTNGDGRIDQNELGNIPDGFRQVMESRGIRLQPGLSVEDFSNNMRQQFEQSRSQGESPTGDREENRSGEQSDSASNRAAYAPSAPFRPREKERMTIDLPSAYTDMDTDFDGQIALYEWIISRRDELDLFDAIDADTDAILTPQELTEHETLASSSEQILAVFKEKYERPRITIVSASGATSTGKDGKSTSKLSKEEKQKQEEMANRIFSFVDRDRDGTISSEEITSNPRIAPMFERAGIKPSDMSQDEFSKKYVKAMEKSGGDAGRGGPPGGGDRGGFTRGGGGPEGGGYTRGGGGPQGGESSGGGERERGGRGR